MSLSSVIHSTLPLQEKYFPFSHLALVLWIATIIFSCSAVIVAFFCCCFVCLDFFNFSATLKVLTMKLPTVPIRYSYIFSTDSFLHSLCQTIQVFTLLSGNSLPGNLELKDQSQSVCLFLHVKTPEMFDSFARNWDKSNILMLSSETAVLHRK